MQPGKQWRGRGRRMTKRGIMSGGSGNLVRQPAWGNGRAPADEDRDAMIVTAANAGTNTENPMVELPQPVTVITSEQFISQSAISMSDTVKYAAGVLANPYGRDTRVDGFNVRGIDALQFRDGKIGRAHF